MSEPITLTKKIHTIPDEELLSHLFPPQAVSELSIKYHSIHEALFLSSPEELATMDSVRNKSICKILAFRELSRRIDLEKSSKVKSFHLIYNCVIWVLNSSV